MSLLRKKSPVSQAMGPVQASDDVASQVYPALVEFLSLTEWEPGDPRETGTLLLCSQEGRWRLWLNDRQHGRSAWLSGATIEEVLAAAEHGLVMDKLEWRGDKEPRRVGRR